MRLQKNKPEALNMQKLSKTHATYFSAVYFTKFKGG